MRPSNDARSAKAVLAERWRSGERQMARPSAFARRRIVRIQASDAVCSGLAGGCRALLTRTVRPLGKYQLQGSRTAQAAAPALVARNDSVCMHADDAV